MRLLLPLTLLATAAAAASDDNGNAHHNSLRRRSRRQQESSPVTEEHDEQAPVRTDKAEDEEPAQDLQEMLTASATAAGAEGVLSDSTLGTATQEVEEEAGPALERVILRYADHDQARSQLDAFSQQFGLDQVAVHHDFEDRGFLSASVTKEERAILEQDPNIQSIEPDPVRTAQVMPRSWQPDSTPRRLVEASSVVSLTAGGDTFPYGIEMVQAQQAWGASKGEGIRVCVIDTGVRNDHEDSPTHITGQDHYWNTTGETHVWNDDQRGHGTHCAGTVAAPANGLGVVGVAPLAEIYAIKGLNNQGSGYMSDLIAAMVECQEAGSHIISMSLGGTAYSSEEEAIVVELAGLGIMMIAAAGNSYGTGYHYPASYKNVTSVGAVDYRKIKPSFSTRNNQVDLAAPGVSVLSTVPPNCGSCSSSTLKYESWSGTSMATPHAAGVAALLMSRFPAASAYEIEQAMYNSALDLGATGKDTYYGHGLVQAVRAMEELNGGAPVAGAECEAGELSLDLSLVTDRFASETTLVVFKGRTHPVPVLVMDDLNNEQMYNHSVCLPGDYYNVTVFDSRRDGICCDYGEGSLSVQFQGLELVNPTLFELTFQHRASFVFGSSPSTTSLPEKSACANNNAGDTDFRVTLETDSYPDELSVRLLDDDTDELVWELPLLFANADYSKHACVEEGQCHSLQIQDVYGNGAPDLKVEVNGTEILHSTSNQYLSFGKGTVIRLGDGCSCMNAEFMSYLYDSYCRVDLVDLTSDVFVWSRTIPTYSGNSYQPWKLNSCLNPNHCYEFTFYDNDRNGFPYTSYYMNFTVDDEVLVDHHDVTGTSKSFGRARFGACG